MDDMEIITLYDEDGEETEFEVLGVINLEDKDYYILTPVDEADEEDAQAYIFRADTDENGEDILVEVEDDDEFKTVSEAWEAICEGGFDDLDEEDEE